MKLQEFLTFKKTCSICNSPIMFNITDYTNLQKPIHMNADQIPSVHVFKFYHKELAIFINAKHNNYMVIPDNSIKIDLRISGHCPNDHEHYLCQSQMDVLDYKEKTWSNFPDMDIIENT